MQSNEQRKRIGVFCSGGDAPGMNACLRAVVRRGIAKKLNIIAIHRGFQGIFDEAFEKMTPRSVGNILQLGGTIIKTARCKKFYSIEGVLEAVTILKKHRLDGLIAIGGDGTFRGLLELKKLWDGQVIGIPGTIDNDIFGTDYTIGYDTAIDTVIQMLDRIRDTAESHERAFVVEVMGRHTGFIALKVGIGCGAEEVLIPEHTIDLETVARRVKVAQKRGKKSIIIIVAEGVSKGNIFDFCNRLTTQKGLEFQTHISILGHVQRGGSPSALDRWLATRLGAFAVDCVLKGDTGIMVGEQNLQLVKIPLEDTQKKKPIDSYAYEIIHDLAI
ncbi:MAG: 6-phosphofructokinase [Candidatus Heimdallarchaeota archaeon]|nr:MAG: 6-phosphofructokinase [Candidatus Heimdallarchaeota archaeon]